MLSQKSNSIKAILVIFTVLFIDQFVKIYIKLHFQLGEQVEVFNWFKIYFIENNGMAFGIEFIGKLFLTLFRIFAVGILIFYIRKLIKNEYRTGYIITIALLTAGAAGNIFDSLFYGMLFSDSYGHLASFMPNGGGYAPFLYGKVVDMFYFPIIKNPADPEKAYFFPWIFNVADSAITVSVAIILLFFRKELNSSLEKKPANDDHIKE